MSPSNVKVIRISGAAMNVSWDTLSLNELQGFSQGYNVYYQVLGSRKRQTTSVQSDPDASYLVITGLIESAGYSVTVSSSTLAGEGPSSAAFVANREWHTKITQQMHSGSICGGHLCTFIIHLSGGSRGVSHLCPHHI